MIGLRGRGAATALLVLSFFLLLASVARADESYPVGASPVLKVTLSSGRLLVQTWDAPQISVGSSGSVSVQHFAAGDPGARVPAQWSIPQQTAQTAQGAVAIPRETFVLPQLGGGPHDAIVVKGSGDTTIMVPRGTALVFAHVNAGRVTIANYDGTFVANSRSGDIYLQHVGGTGFAQSVLGTVNADNSSFTRLRARTAVGDMNFRNCSSNQIEATSTYGSIVYDNGQFQPGLARFESQYGNVAVGVQNGAGGVQIGAHSGSGHIVSNFADGTPVSGSSSDTQANVRGGGPVVTTSSQNGSVYLYNGSMSAHPAVQQNLESSNSVYSAQRPVIGSPRISAPSNYPGSSAAAAGRMQPSGMQSAAGHTQTRAQQPQPRRPAGYPVPQPTPGHKHHKKPPQQPYY